MIHDLITHRSYKSGIPRRARIPHSGASARARFQAPFLFCENESLLPSAGWERRNVPLSLYGRKVARGSTTAEEAERPKTASPRCRRRRRHRYRRGRLLLGRHEEVRSDNNEFRCRPSRPCASSASRKVGDVNSPRRPSPDRFSSTAMWTIVSNFYCANEPVSWRGCSQSPRLIRHWNDEERERWTSPRESHRRRSLLPLDIDRLRRITTRIV